MKNIDIAILIKELVAEDYQVKILKKFSEGHCGISIDSCQKDKK